MLTTSFLPQPFNNKSEIEERLETEIGQLKDIISQVKFSTSVVPTPEMGAEIEGLSAAITDFLNHALQYQKKWCIGECQASCPHTRSFRKMLTLIAFDSQGIRKYTA